MTESKSKYGDLLNKAKQVSKPDNQTTGKPASQQTSEPDKEVNLSVRVPESLRRHWAAEAKRTGTTMTAVIIDALTKEFGKPDK